MRLSKSSSEESKDSKANTTASNIKDAFNSPFPPFVLVTTSIGQEGLDFHSYCHQIWHWDLPSNPVDLEQRDGRLKRYKNYAVRKNIHKDFKEYSNWESKFIEAKNRTKCDFRTFWLYKSENATQDIQRIVPVIPYTKEYNKYEQLKKQLVVYRKVMGQNKHNEILNGNIDIPMISLLPQKS
jgi:ERCC4-related helicase